MKHTESWRAAVAAGLSTFLFFIIISGCKKNKDSAVVEISDLSAGNEKVVNLEFLPGNQTVDVITIKNTGSGKAHVKFATDTAVSSIGAIPLPAANYTPGNLEFDIPANNSITLQAIINRTGLTVDQPYGVGFKIESVEGGSIANGSQSIKVKFDLRNRWDGRYKVTGNFVDIAAPTLTFTEQEVNLVTTGPASVVMIPKDLGIPGYLILSGTSLSYYGSFGPVFNFDPASNKVVSVVNSYGQPASNTRAAELDPSGVNKWDAATKSMSVKFYMKQSNTVTTPPHIRVYFNNTFINLGNRY
jgi:hypothetical protein